MLVVICAIRKFLEYFFARRELRVLDDLLPESGKPRRSGGGRFFSKMKAGDHDDEDDEDDEVDALNREAEKREDQDIRVRTPITIVWKSLDLYGKK